MSRRIAKSKAKRALAFAPENEDLNEEQLDSISAHLPSSSQHSLSPRDIILLFKTVFKSALQSENLQSHIQSVKKNLYDRAYMEAFDSDDKRLAYATRWTPARTLSYSSLFGTLPEVRELLKSTEEDVNVLCVGGGAGAELVGLVSVYSKLKENVLSHKGRLNVNIIDIADWSGVLDVFNDYMLRQWSGNFGVDFLKGDVLGTNVDVLKLGSINLVTLLFTTNELFTEKRKESMDFLHNLNRFCRKGSYLLIAESAGSYSNISIGSKEFPIQFLIDMVLVGKPDTKDGPWEILQESESCWFRINQREVEYDMKLENMRFFYRFYRKK